MEGNDCEPREGSGRKCGLDIFPLGWMVPRGPLRSLIVPGGLLWSLVQPNNLTSASAASSSLTNMEGNWGPHICCLWHASSKFGLGLTLCQSIHSSLHLWVVHPVVSVVDRQSISSPCGPIILRGLVLVSCLVLCSVAGMHNALCRRPACVWGGDDMVCWHSMLTGVSSWACSFYAQSCTRDDLLVSILPDRERVKG